MQPGPVLLETTGRQIWGLMQQHPHSGVDECNLQYRHRSHHSSAPSEGTLCTTDQPKKEADGNGHVFSWYLVSNQERPSFRSGWQSSSIVLRSSALSDCTLWLYLQTLRTLRVSCFLILPLPEFIWRFIQGTTTTQLGGAPSKFMWVSFVHAYHQCGRSSYLSAHRL